MKITDPTLEQNRTDRDPRGRQPRAQIPQAPPMQAVKPPRWFDKYAKEAWLRLRTMLHEAGMLTDLDLETFQALCLTYERLRRIQEALEQEGYTIKEETPAGEMIQAPHPLLKVAYEESYNMLRYSRKFGLTPGDRCKITPARHPSVEERKGALDSATGLADMMMANEARERELREGA